MSDHVDRLRSAYEALGRGDAGEFEDLFAADAKWLGVPGSGMDGETPI